MTVVASFTLCPSNPPLVPCKEPTVPNKKRKELPLSSPAAGVHPPAVVMDGHMYRATMNGYTNGHTNHQYMHPVRGNAYQANPFHPLVHQRKMISPLRVEDLNIHHQQAHAHQRREMRVPYHQPQHLPSTGRGGQAPWSHLGAEPPVAEIEIPIGGAHVDSSKGHANQSSPIGGEDDDDDSWMHDNSAQGDYNDYDEHSFERLESWKSMYFVAQRDLHVARAESQAVEEENRRLKRHLFELQRRLFESQRKRQRLANDMWKVPGSSSDTPTTRSGSKADNGKSQKHSVSSTLETTENHRPSEHNGMNKATSAKPKNTKVPTRDMDPRCRVPRAISSEESSGNYWGERHEQSHTASAQ